MVQSPESPAAIAPSDVENAFALAEAAARHVAPFLRGDAASAALVAWAERRGNWDPDRGKLSTYVWASMSGKAKDEQRSYCRFARRSLAPNCATTQAQSGPIAIRQALDHVQTSMDSGELVVLQEVYFGDGSLREAAVGCGRSEDAMHRAHQRLLTRLREQLAERQPRGAAR